MCMCVCEEEMVGGTIVEGESGRGEWEGDGRREWEGRVGGTVMKD